MDQRLGYGIGYSRVPAAEISYMRGACDITRLGYGIGYSRVPAAEISYMRGACDGRMRAIKVCKKDVTWDFVQM